MTTKHKNLAPVMLLNQKSNKCKVYLCLCLHHSKVSVKALCFWAVPFVHLFVHPSIPFCCLFVCQVRYCYHDISWIAWTVLIKLNREYSLAPTDDLIVFWMSEVKGECHSRPSKSYTMSHELL